MRHSIALLLGSACLLLCPLPASPVHADETNATIPLGNFHGRPLVDLTIAGQGPFTFILDTGSETAVIDQTLAAKLGLENRGKTEIGSPLGGTVPANRIVLDDVRVGGVSVGSLEGHDMDLAAVIGSDGPVGVLSTSSFGERSLIFDFAADRLTVSHELLPAANGVDVFDYCVDDAIPSIPVDIAGRPHCVHLDTGAPSVLFLPLSDAEELPLEAEPAIRGRARVVGNEVTIYGARLAGELRAGPIVMPGPEIGFMEQARIGNVGQGFLRNLELTLDHTHRRLRVRPLGGAAAAGSSPQRQVRRVAAPEGKKRYGMRFQGSLDGALSVASVDPGSPAEAGGLQAGDRILSINGVPLEELATADRMTAFQASKLELEVQRGDAAHLLSLSLD